MKTVLICNQKGGVGKTMIADEIAFAFDRDGIPYNFYDLDGQGGTIHEPTERPDAKVNILDTPGALQADMKKWIEEASVIIIPTKMTTRDIPPLEKTMELIGNTRKPVIYVLNAWNHYKASADFEEWFHSEHPKCKTLVIPQSEVFVQAAAEAKSVCEYRPHSTPAEKVTELVNEIKKALKM